jgi:hypothetical protein
MSPALVLFIIVAAEPTPWKVIDTQEGMTLSSRELPGERVVELKVTAVSPKSIEALCLQAYGTATIEKDEPTMKARKLIREAPNERVTYDQVSTPIVSDRDYAVKATHQVLPNGNCRVTFDIDNDEAPPLPKGFVRIEKLHGQWDFEPKDNGTACTYVIFTDPAGSVPAFVVEGARQKTAYSAVKRVLSRAKATVAPDAGHD